MKPQTRIIIFSLSIIIGYTLYSTFSVPRIVPEPPPVETTLNLSEATAAEAVAIGARLYGGKGACKRCHASAGMRAPSLEAIFTASGERLRDPRYKGKATDAASYIYESMIDPSIYVVKGFGKRGTDDGVSPMPSASDRAAGLTSLEVLAVIAYLEHRAGIEVTWPKLPPATEAKEAP